MRSTHRRAQAADVRADDPRLFGLISESDSGGVRQSTPADAVTANGGSPGSLGPTTGRASLYRDC
jgi:hypothetical protein